VTGSCSMRRPRGMRGGQRQRATMAGEGADRRGVGGMVVAALVSSSGAPVARRRQEGQGVRVVLEPSSRKRREGRKKGRATMGGALFNLTHRGG
jgi:hypothetical protein